MPPSTLPAQCLSASFMDSLPEPFLGIARECIPERAKALLPPAERADLLEIHLRSHLLKLIQESLDDPDALEDVGIFWKRSLELCLHFCIFCDKGTDERYKGMSVRKLPLLLLEDALDALPLKSFQHIWETTVETSLDILFASVLWNPAPKNFPCSLPFIKLCNKFLRKVDVHKNDWPGCILMTLARAFPLSDKSATKIWGSFHTENVTEFESQGEFDAQQAQQQSYDHDGSGQHPHHNKQLQTYSFYETFWSVQQDFSNPTGIKVADFLERMNTILAALESHPLIRSHTISMDGTANRDRDTPPHVKYLTSSHLLPIQLGDPEFRIHFLTQFLIVENHLSSESPALGNMLGQLNKRAKDLLGRIQPHGHKHLQILDFLLQHREKYWRLWKKNKCQPDMETPLVVAEEENSKKRRILEGPLGADAAPVVKIKKDEEELLIDFILHEKKDLKATCALEGGCNRNTRSKLVPSLEEYLEPYVDALDPDSGIEPEYHPKNDTLFTWRALRLLSRDHLAKFHMINHKGDFEKMVRHIYTEEKGIHIPGEPPQSDEPTIDLAPTNEEEPDEGEKEKQDTKDEDEDEDKKMDPIEEGNIDQDMVDAGEEKAVVMDVQQEESQPNTPSVETPASVKGKENEEQKEDAYNGKEGEEDPKEEESEDTKPVKHEGSGNEKRVDRESPMPLDDDAQLNDDADRGPVNDDDDLDEPTRVKVLIESEDEGEIEESRAGKKEKGSTGSAAEEDEKVTVKEIPTAIDEAPPKEEQGGGDDRISDRRNEDGGDRSGRQPQRHGGDFHGRQQNRADAGRGSGGHDRNDVTRIERPHDRVENVPEYSRDHNRDRGAAGRHNAHKGGRGGGGHPRSDGGDRRGGGGSRPFGPPGGPPPGGGPPGGGSGGRRGGPPIETSGGGAGRREDRRGGDERWEDRRTSSGGGGGVGGGGPGRRDDRRGGGGDRRGDRRGGPGGGGGAGGSGGGGAGGGGDRRQRR